MWIPLSFVYAFFNSLQNVYFKKSAIKINPVLMAWSVLIISGLSFSPLLLLGIPALNSTFWWAVFLRLLIDSLAFTLYIKGVQLSPLSLTIPMLSLSPALSIATVYLINGLAPSAYGFLGVVLTMSGLYWLNFDHSTKDFLSPFKSINKEKGVLYVAIAAILWSIVSSLQKLAIDNSNVYFYTAFFQLFWAMCFTPIAYFADSKAFMSIFRPNYAKFLLPVGLIDALKTIAQNVAYVFALPAYVNSIGNTDILFSSFFGAILFKEKIDKHLLPLIVVFLGITLIVLA